MSEEFLINLDTNKSKDMYESTEYIIDYINYMINIISNTNHSLINVYIDVLLSYKTMEYHSLVKKIRPIEVIFIKFNLISYGSYKRNKVINREIMVEYIHYLIKLLNNQKNINDEPILDALYIYLKYKHYETIKEKLVPIENYLNTSLKEFLNKKI